MSDHTDRDVWDVITFPRLLRDVIKTSAMPLIGMGFEQTSYFGHRGIFFKAEVPIRAMPIMSQQVDNEVIFKTSTARIEVTPARRVQLMITDTGYMEYGISLDSEDGLRLVADAIAGMRNLKNKETI